MKNKKGAELSVNVIIIAIIALVVLVVLFAIFTGRMNIFSGSVKNCDTNGGTCTSLSSGQTCASIGQAALPFNCTGINLGKSCCTKL